MPNTTAESSAGRIIANVTDDCPVIAFDIVKRLLGLKRDFPLKFDEMVRALRVTAFRRPRTTARVESFIDALLRDLGDMGVTIVEWDALLQESRRNRVPPGYIVLTPADQGMNDLATDYVSSLSDNVIVGIYDHPCPAHARESAQGKIDAIISDFVWDILQVTIYLDDRRLTVCTLNGSIDDYAFTEVERTEFLKALVAKLAAPVLPPKADTLLVEAEAFDPACRDLAEPIADIVESGPIWQETGVFVYQTKIDRLKFRNKYYRRIATAFVDHRTGMSYGYLARQLAIPTLRPALTADEAQHAFGVTDWENSQFHEIDGKCFICLTIDSICYVVEIPPVWLLSTRSGCTKSNLDARRDITRMGLVDGQMYFQTPIGVRPESDCKPSYDTGVMLAHALGNAILASVLGRISNGQSPFFKRLRSSGVGIAHWHGYLSESQLPVGYFLYGEDNLPVPCSTPQSASLALSGKLDLLRRVALHASAYRGDVHVEPQHGVNMMSDTLTNLAEWLAQRLGRDSETRGARSVAVGGV